MAAPGPGPFGLGLGVCLVPVVGDDQDVSWSSPIRPSVMDPPRNAVYRCIAEP